MVVLGPPSDGDESRKTSSHPVLDSKARGSRGPLFYPMLRAAMLAPFRIPRPSSAHVLRMGSITVITLGLALYVGLFLSSGETHVMERKVFSELGHGVEDTKFGFTHRKRSSNRQKNRVK